MKKHIHILTVFFSTLFFILLFVYPSQAQETLHLLDNAKKHMYNDPEQAIKICEHVIKNTTDTSKKITANLIKAKSYTALGDIETSVKIVFDIKWAIETSKDNPHKIELLLFASSMFKILGMNDLSNQYILSAKNIAQKEKDSLYLNQIIATKAIDSAASLLTSGNPKKTLALLHKKKKHFKTSKKTLQQSYWLQLSKTHLATQHTDSALYYVSKLNHSTLSNYYKMKLGLLLGKIYFHKKNYPHAIENLKQALVIAENWNHAAYKKEIYETLMTNYLTTDDKRNFQHYNQKFSIANNLLNTQEVATTNKIFELIIQEQKARYTAEEQKYYYRFAILGTTTLLLVLIAVFMNWKNRSSLTHIKNNIKYIKLSEKIKNSSTTQKKELGKSVTIPKETEALLLNKLEKFEQSTYFTNQEMSLASLAARFETNTKYLSEIINKHKGKNFNLYINELRVSYIIKKLQNDPHYLHYKVSYLAEESGFSSHSSFTTVFKSITGISPTVFIDLLKEEIQNKQNNKDQ